MEGVEPHLQNLVPYLIQTLEDPKVDKVNFNFRKLLLMNNFPSLLCSPLFVQLHVGH